MRAAPLPRCASGPLRTRRFCTARRGGERTSRIAVQRAVAHVRLAFVAGVHEHPAMRVRQRHEAHHTATRLGVLGRKPRERTAARGCKRPRERLKRLHDRHGVRVDAQVARKHLGVLHGMRTGIGTRQQHAVHVVDPQRVDAHHRRKTGIHAARQPDDRIGEPRALHERTQRFHACSVLVFRFHASPSRRSFVTSARVVVVLRIAPFRGRACFARKGKRKRGERGATAARSVGYSAVRQNGGILRRPERARPATWPIPPRRRPSWRRWGRWGRSGSAGAPTPRTPRGRS